MINPRAVVEVVIETVERDSGLTKLDITPGGGTLAGSMRGSADIITKCCSPVKAKLVISHEEEASFL